jgi:hypothetical protein
MFDIPMSTYRRRLILPTHQETIDQAKNTMLQAKQKLVATLSDIPDAYVTYSPSESARTPLQIVVHCASAIRFIQEQMAGKPFDQPSTAAADRAFRIEETSFDSRQQALDYFDAVTNDYLIFLDSLTESDLVNSAALPFGLGMLPVKDWLGAAPGHTQGHIAQLEYIQTIYGDRDWRLGG